MKDRARRLSAASALLFFSAGAALLAQTAISSTSTPGGSTVITRDSRPVRLLRTWYDDIKTRRGDVPRRVDIVYDYRQAAAYERAYTLDGRLIWNRRVRVNPPQPTPEEIAEAHEIVRADPELSRVMARFSAELEGGFLAEERQGRPCGPGTRCVLVQVVAPHHGGLVRWTAVDLVKQRIAYPSFVPSEIGGVK
jgi:hypothetical protein